MKKWSICAILLVGLIAALMLRADAPPTEFKTRVAREAKAEFDSKVREISRDAQTKIGAAQKEYVSKLEKAKSIATQDGDLEDAVRIRNAITELKPGAPDGIGGDAAPSRLLTDRSKLARDLAATIWLSNGVTYRFNADGTGSSNKETWLWTPVDRREVFLRTDGGYTDRLTFDEQLSTFSFQDYGTGTRRGELTGKRVKS